MQAVSLWSPEGQMLGTQGTAGGCGCSWAGSQRHCKREHPSLASDLAAVQRLWAV